MPLGRLCDQRCSLGAQRAALDARRTADIPDAPGPHGPESPPSYRAAGLCKRRCWAFDCQTLELNERALTSGSAQKRPGRNPPILAVPAF